MKRTYRVTLGVLALLVLAAATAAVLFSHESPCGAAPPLPAGATRMKAIVYRCYGGPQVLKLEDVAKPVPADDRVLVRVRASSVNPLDWHYMRGTPYVMRAEAGFGAPTDPTMGVDFAGTVESVGRAVTRFKPGDDVFGGRDGAFAEYVSVAQNGSLAMKPANVSFEQAAAVPIAAVTALQALRDYGKVRPGQKVLINGASGGVGTFAVQIAKAMGADVTGVCSGRNVARVRSLGADRVIDYTRDDFTRGTEPYDLIVDTVGNHSLSDLRHVLTSQGALIMVGGPSGGKWLGALTGPLKARLVAPFVSQKLIFMLADLSSSDLVALGDLMRAGKVTPVIDRSYPLAEVPAAIEYLERGHARGKVVITVQ